MDEIIEATRAFVSDKAIDTASAKAKMAELMPKAYNSGMIDETVWKVFSPSMALLDIDLQMEDYSCCMFPALRALEGYLLFLLDEIGELLHLVPDKERRRSEPVLVDPVREGRFVFGQIVVQISAGDQMDVPVVDGLGIVDQEPRIGIGLIGGMADNPLLLAT